MKVGKSKEQKAADRRARYAKRVADQRCPQCGAKLIEGEPGRMCPECDERMAAARARYEERNPSRPGRGRGVKPETRRKNYHAKAASKMCVAQGCREDAMRNCTRCRKHRHAQATASRNYQRRKVAERRAGEQQLARAA